MSVKFIPSRIELYCHPVDLRKGQNGLLLLVEQELNRDSTEEVLFLFSNRSRSLVKCLFWDRTGYCVLSKRLLSGRFVLPHKDEQVVIDRQSLRLLLDGLSIFSS